MNYYSQRDPRWALKKLGFSNSTIGHYGCKMTCFSCIDGRDPIIMNQLFKDGGAFIGDLLYDDGCAHVLGWEFQGRVYADPKRLCIAEVDFNPDPKKDQHFVVWLGNGRIVDPWYGMEMENPYKVLSYRLFLIKNMKTYYIKSDLRNWLKDKIDEDFDHEKGDDHKDMAKKLDDSYGALEDLIDAQKYDLDKLKNVNSVLDSNNKELKKTFKLQQETIEELEKELEDAQTPIGDMTITQLIGQIIVIIKNKL